MEPDEHFIQDVQDVLAHLYDYPYLQTHPLTDQLQPDHQFTPQERKRFLRTRILEAIEELNPGPQVPFRSLQARTYNVLNLRYVEGLTVGEVARELAVSERQVYRDLRRAEQDLASLLWTRHQPAAGRGPQREELVRQEAERVGSSVQEVCLQDLVQGALAAVDRLGQQRGVRLEVHLREEPILVYTDRLLARQALVSLLSFCIQSAAPGGVICLLAHPTGAGAHVQIHYMPEGVATSPDLPPVAAQQLVKRLGGRWSVDRQASGLSTIGFMLGGRPGNIVLVIDDNAGLIELFRRYLVDTDYQVIGAANGLEGLRLTEESAPAVIVLDVMMPQNDGWEVLQWLRNREETRHIPVIVCSVLDDPQLAYSLGAAGFLAKPVNRSQLLQALARCRADTPAQPPPTSPAGR